MKRKMILAAVLLLFASTAHAAFTNPAASIRWNHIKALQDNGFVDTWMEEAEDYLDGTTAVTGMKANSMLFVKTDTPPTEAEGWIYWDDSENILKAYTGAAWVTLGSGTFAGGNITSDVTLNADGVDILPTTTTAHTWSIRAYDVDGTAYRDVLRWTNGDTPAVVLGAAQDSLAIASTGLNVTTGGNVTGVGQITTSGTASINDSASTATTSIGGGTTTGAVNIGAGASTQTINVGTGAGAKTLTLGSTTSTSPTVIYGGSTGITMNTGTSNGPIAIGNANGTTAITTSDWTISTAGAIAKADSIAGNNSNTINLAINQRFEFTDNSETFGFDVGTTSNTVELVTDSAITDMDFNDVDRLKDVEYIEGDLGAKVDLSINERVEFKDGAETFGFILNGSNKIEWATDSAVNTIDFNDLDALEDIESITGDNGQVVQFGNNNRVELTENSDSLGLIFGSNKIELAACGDGVDTIDFNDLDALEDIEKITFDSGAFISQPADNRVEITENSDTLGFIFGSNKIELARGGEGVTTLDFNDIDLLEDIKTITAENGQVIQFNNNNRIEFTENSDSLGLIFGSNAIELAACSDGVVTIDFNDIDKLEDVEYVQGDTGVKMVLTANEQVLFVDGAESFGFDLGGSNTIVLATDTGATDLDMNDVDRLIGIEYITGDNGNKLDFSVNERFEFGDTEKFGIALGTSNTVEFVTDSGVDTVDFNDVDKLVDVESITGDGAGGISGFVRLVTNDSEPHAVTTAESGKVLTNLGSDGADAWTLPSAAAGLEYIFVVAVAQEMRITPAAGDKINHAGTLMDAAEYYWADAIGESIHLIAVDTTNWIMISSTGTWTEQNP